MFRRVAVVIALTFVCSNIASAGPISWIKHQFRDHPTRTSIIVGMGTATWHGLALAHCHEGTVESCQAKYGAAWPSFAAATVINFAVIASTHSCWKDQPRAFCSIFAYGGSTVQAGFAVAQWRNKSFEPTKNDLR